MKFAPALILSILLPAMSLADPQPQASAAAAAKQNWNLMVGDWTMVGAAKDSPTDAEYPVEWTLHGIHIRQGLFVQVDQAWKGHGEESHTREIVSYDPITRTHSTHGFSDDGSTWVGAGTQIGHTIIEKGITTDSSGKATKWRDTYVYGTDWTTVSATEEVEQDGSKWTASSVKGTKARGSE